jgi:hypothetical protein
MGATRRLLATLATDMALLAARTYENSFVTVGSIYRVQFWTPATLL